MLGFAGWFILQYYEKKAFMTNQELQDFLYHEIPMAKALGVQVLEASELNSTVLGPLTLNRNHMDTAFGGSLSSLLILSCYAWLFHRLDNLGYKTHVLIQAGHTDYLLPVKEDIKASAVAPPSEEFEKFLTTFTRKGIGRISLSAKVLTAEGVACTFKGEFVAQKVI